MNTQTKTQTTVDFKYRAQHEPLINYTMQHLGKSRKIILQTKLQIIVVFFSSFLKEIDGFFKRLV